MRTLFAPSIPLAAVAAAAVTLSSCEDLPIGDKTSPYYWSEVFQDMYADELVVGELEPGPEPLEAPRAVLLITGVTIDEEWFGPIVARLERDGFEPHVYVPPALLSGSLFENAEDLADVVEQVRAESGQERIDILAECTGGVIARHYVQSLGGDAHVARLVTFVSPHHGIDKAPMAAAIAKWPALYDLSPGSDFLEAVNSAPLPETVDVTSIYTCNDEYIQPWQGSIVPGATNNGLCDEFVGHFQTFYDPAIYLIMHEALTAPTGDTADDFGLPGYGPEPGGSEGGADPGEEPAEDPTDPTAEPGADPTGTTEPTDDPTAEPGADPTGTTEPTDDPTAEPGADPGADPLSGHGDQGPATPGAADPALDQPSGEGSAVASPSPLPVPSTVAISAPHAGVGGCGAAGGGHTALPLVAALGVMLAVARKRLTSRDVRANVRSR
jgi:hypothetical protein